MDVPILHYYCRGVGYKNVRVEIFWNWIKSYSQYTETEVIGPVQLRSWRRNIFATMIRVLGGMEKSLLTTLWNVWVKNGGSIRCPVVFHKKKIGLSMMWKFQCKEIIIIVVFSFACLLRYLACTTTGGSQPLFDQTFVSKNKVRKTRIALAVIWGKIRTLLDWYIFCSDIFIVKNPKLGFQCSNEV